MKKKKLTEKQKHLARIRKLENEVADQDYRRGKALAEVARFESLYKNEQSNSKHYQVEKDRYYTETQVQKAKIHRLEKAVTALKEAHQKTLLAFDVLN
jgi:hypothetical protein